MHAASVVLSPHGAHPTLTLTLTLPLTLTMALPLLSLSGVRSNMFADLPSSSLAEIAMLMDLHEVPAGHYFLRHEP